jgi:predicted RNA-binding Zn ribbon-like protein
MEVSKKRRPPSAFEISGGDLALDLTNTRERRPTDAPLELLHAYADVVAWGVEAGAVPADVARTLLTKAARRPSLARAAFRRAVDVREALCALFSAAANGRPAPEHALGLLDAELRKALVRQRLVPRGSRARWAWSEDTHFDRILWPVLRAAAALLTSPDLSRLRECGASECAWLFLDQSRNGSRRWCDMTVCGNREKARRFQRRTRRAGAAGDRVTS